MGIFRRTPKPVPLQAYVEILNLQPDDGLVLTLPRKFTLEQAQQLRESLSEWAAIDAKRILVVQDARISVLRHGDPPPPPVYIAPAKEARGI